MGKTGIWETTGETEESEMPMTSAATGCLPSTHTLGCCLQCSRASFSLGVLQPVQLVTTLNFAKFKQLPLE